ncbi:MAG: hypothetical protein KF830_00255 [Planctomycetes bacterium]|nr:hypothetical protein [Planctomycetota bacterium]
MVISKDQYETIASRRATYDSMLWQTPVLSLTAQSFLFTIALDAGSAEGARVISSVLALAAAVASMHLMSKHRLFEVQDSHRLSDFEQAQEGWEVVHGRPLSSGVSAYKVWMVVLAVFAVAAAVAIIGVVASWPWLTGAPANKT